MTSKRAEIFVGTWGESYYTDYYGGPNDIPLNQYYIDLRTLLAAAMLDAIPANRSIAVRYISMKKMLTKRATPVTSLTDTFNAAINASRIGIFNDAFLSGSTKDPVIEDMGTYEDEADRVFHEKEAPYILTGGETNLATSDRTSCPYALTDLQRFGYSYLNLDYHPDVISKWRSGGCFAEISKRLGYRFQLLNVTTEIVNSARQLRIKIVGKNTGFGIVYNPRVVRIHAFSQVDASGKKNLLCKSEISKIDVRRWGPGAHFTEVFDIGFPATLSNQPAITFYLEISPEGVNINNQDETVFNRIVFANVETIGNKNRTNFLFQEPALELSKQLPSDSGYLMDCSLIDYSTSTDAGNKDVSPTTTTITTILDLTTPTTSRPSVTEPTKAIQSPTKSSSQSTAPFITMLVILLFSALENLI